MPDIEVLSLKCSPTAVKQLFGEGLPLCAELLVIVWQQTIGIPLAEDVLRA